MGKRSRKRFEPPEYLREWRASLGLSRQAVVCKIAEINPLLKEIDQATVSKWESGETAVRVQDFILLAQVYGTTADRLFFSPSDQDAADMHRRLSAIIGTRDPVAVQRWLDLGDLMLDAAKSG